MPCVEHRPGRAPACRRCQGQPRADGGRPSRRCRQRVLRHGGHWLPCLLVLPVGLHRPQRGEQLQLASALVLQGGRDLGLPRRLDPLLDGDARMVGRRGRLLRPPPARRDGRPRDGRARPRRHGLPPLHAAHLQSVPAPLPCARRGRGPQSAAAGPGHGFPSAAPLSGLRGLRRAVRLRDRRAHLRSS